jgi:hypothetical protein
MPTALDEMIERISKATGPDREIDCALHVALFGWKLARLGKDYDGGNECAVWTRDGELIAGFAYPPWGKLDPYYHVPDVGYTASLDATIALCVRVLPGWHWHVETIAKPHTQWIAEIYDHEADRPRRVKQGHSKATPALALCLAILRALTAQKTGGDR